jgi:hypothetical protein
MEGGDGGGRRVGLIGSATAMMAASLPVDGGVERALALLTQPIAA